MDRRSALVTAVVIAGISAGFLWAGPLNPPAGPVGATGKTLTEVEPRIAISSVNTPGNGTNVYVISQPGSYYLTDNVAVPSGKNGIAINSSRVTIDLRGFSVTGVTGSLEGITALGSPASITIRSGTVSNCGSNGINLSFVAGSSVSDVMLYGNHGYGLGVSANSTVRNCSASNQTQAGFSSAGGCVFSHCTSYWNGVGFVSSQSDIYESCVAQSCTGVGFSISVDTRVSNCQAIGNGSQGIVCNNDNWISGCQVHSNGGTNMAGIWVQGVFNHIEGNDVVNNGYGIYVGGASNFVYRNKVGSNTQSNFYIIAGNHVGTIGTAGTNAGLINGNTGGGMGALESDPNANLIY